MVSANQLETLHAVDAVVDAVWHSSEMQSRYFSRFNGGQTAHRYREAEGHDEGLPVAESGKTTMR